MPYEKIKTVDNTFINPSKKLNFTGIQIAAIYFVIGFAVGVVLVIALT